MNDDESIKSLNILVVGDAFPVLRDGHDRRFNELGVLCMTFAEGKYVWNCTLSMEDQQKTIEIDDVNYCVNLKQAVFMEEYSAIRRLGYCECDAVVVIFSIGNTDSFHKCEEIFAEIAELDREPLVMLVGTQPEWRSTNPYAQILAEERKRPISHEEGAQLAKKFGAKHYLECSTTSYEGVEEVFATAGLEFLNPKPAENQHPPQPRGFLSKLFSKLK